MNLILHDAAAVLRIPSGVLPKLLRARQNHRNTFGVEPSRATVRRSDLPALYLEIMAAVPAFAMTYSGFEVAVYRGVLRIADLPVLVSGDLGVIS